MRAWIYRATSDLTALVLIAAHEGKWHVRPTFWLPEEGLLEKARHDRVPYDLWHRQGFLETTPGRAIEYECVAEHLRGLFDRYDIRQLAFDRWNLRHLKPWLEKAGFNEKRARTVRGIRSGLSEHEPGAARSRERAAERQDRARQPSGADDVRGECGGRDGSGWQQEAGQRKARGRIDGMVALTMARGVASTEELVPPPQYQFW